MNQLTMLDPVVLCFVKFFKEKTVGYKRTAKLLEAKNSQGLHDAIYMGLSKVRDPDLQHFVFICSSLENTRNISSLNVLCWHRLGSTPLKIQSFQEVGLMLHHSQ